MRTWDNPRDMRDAPDRYSPVESEAWADGYNAAIANVMKALDEALERERVSNTWRGRSSALDTGLFDTNAYNEEIR